MEIVSDKSIWNKYLSSFEKTDIFHSFEYIKSIMDDGGLGYPEAVYYEDDTGRVFYPYLRRPLTMPWIPEKYRFFSDISSPFGAGGYVFEGSIKGFLELWPEFVKTQRIISEFIRIHPFFQPDELLGSILLIGEFIYIDLNKFASVEDVFHSFSKGHRADIKFAQKNYQIEQISFDNFGGVFRQFTLSRDLPRQFEVFQNFKDINQVLPEAMTAYGCFIEDQLTVASLFLHSAKFTHYFLSGSTQNLRGAYGFLLWTAIERAKNDGCQWFSFGGGASLNDSIFRFKKGFSENTLPYRICRVIHDEIAYKDCAMARRLHTGNDSALFPAYRSFAV